MDLQEFRLQLVLSGYYTAERLFQIIFDFLTPDGHVLTHGSAGPRWKLHTRPTPRLPSAYRYHSTTVPGTFGFSSCDPRTRIWPNGCVTSSLVNIAHHPAPPSLQSLSLQQVLQTLLSSGSSISSRTNRSVI